MEEHFNESYVESDNYPKAIFKGELVGYSKNSSSNSYPIKGTLNFHGVTRTIEVVWAEIDTEKDKLSFRGSLELNPTEFDVDIPKIVSFKIAKTVAVVFDFNLKIKDTKL